MTRGKTRSKENIEEMVQNLIPMLQRGVKLKTACYKAEIPYTTILDYMEKYEWLRTRINGAEAMFETVMTNSIFDTAKKDGRLALDVMSRIDKNRWSTRTETDITSKGDSITTIKVEYFDNDPKNPSD